MKVILLKDVRGCGQAHEVKDVADGYARNFLFPHKWAEAATGERIKEFEARKQQHQAEIEKEEEQLGNKLAALRGKKITLESRATEKGGLFKAVSLADIVKAVRMQLSLEIPESVITLANPIKTVGEHAVSLHSKSQKADLTVVITPAL